MASLFVTDSTTDRLIAEGDAMMRAMQIELNKAPLSERMVMRKGFDIRTREWEEVKRVILSATSTEHGGPSSSSNLERWRQGKQLLENANTSVYRATAVAQENEAIGAEVMSELAVQRDTLVRTRDRLVDANEDLSRTHRILRTMNRRVLTNKCLLIFIILMEIAILAGLVYIRFLSKR